MKDVIDGLRAAGYVLDLEGETIRFTYAADGEPDASVAVPLLQRLRNGKAEALTILSSERITPSYPPDPTATLQRAWKRDRFSRSIPLQNAQNGVAVADCNASAGHCNTATPPADDPPPRCEADTDPDVLFMVACLERWPERAEEWRGLDWANPIEVAVRVFGCRIRRAVAAS